VLAACRAWLQAETSDGRARVVTGAPGSGKSAVLGQVVLSRGELAIPLARVHARGQQTEEVARAIGSQLGYTTLGPDHLIAELTARAAPVAVVLDSLDEAANAAGLERELLRGLAACPQVRLIVGVRSRPGKPPLSGARVELDLDSPEFFDAADVEGYAFALLTASDPVKAAYAPESAHAPARQVARLIAERARKSFLYARLASRGLAAAAPVNTTEPNWKDTLNLADGIEAMFGADLDRFDPETRRRFIDLLVPLAYARRRGLPQKHIWATVASRIANKRHTNADIRELKERAGFYLIQDTEDGETVYRLFHQSFADYLKNLTADDEVEAQFAAALEDLVEEAGGWREVREPYLLAAFPSHAAAAGKLGTALEDVAFLMAAAPSGLLPELHQVHESRAWPLAQAYRQTSHWFAAGEHREGARYLMLAALEYQSTVLSGRLTELYEKSSAWWPRWARWSSTVAGWVAVEAGAPIIALCTSRDRDGEPLAVCGHEDGSVSIWRLNNRARVLEYRPREETSPVNSLAVADCQGEQIIVGSWAAGSVWAFRQETGETTGHWKAARADDLMTLTNVVTIDDEGTPVAAVGCATELLLFELPALVIRAHRTDAAKASLYFLAVTRWNNKPVIVSGGGRVRHKGRARSWPPNWWSIEGRARSCPLNLWGIDGLECLLADGSDAVDAPGLLPIDVAGESFLLTRGVGQGVTARRVADLELVGQWPLWFDYIATYPGAAETVIFWIDFGRIRDARARLVRSGDSGVPALELSLEPTGAGADTPADASHWAGSVLPDGRPILMSAASDRVQVWEVFELLRPASAPAGVAPTNWDVCSLTRCGETLFVGTGSGVVLALDRTGNPLWSKNLENGAIRSLAVDSDGAELLAGSNYGTIFRLDAATGGNRHPFLVVGSIVRVLVVRRTADGEQVFAAIGLNGPRGRDLYLTRVWDLSTGEEVRTWKSRAGPAVLEREWEWNIDHSSVNGFEPALALSGSRRTKVLFGMTAFEFEGRQIVALAGPDGEVEVIDAGALKVLNAWTGGATAYDVMSLAGSVINGAPYVFGGDERGVLFRGGILRGAVGLRVRNRAHRGAASVLTIRESPMGWVLASGGADGYVRLWTVDLEPLIEINAGRAVTALAWPGDDLAIGTDRGVICVTLRWPVLFRAKNGLPTTA
jgi:WD40 repeat protein